VNSSLQQSNSSLCESSPQYNQGQVPADGDNSYKLVWSDEFHCLDLNRWNIDYGNNNGWGNGEKQYYTDRDENLFVHNNVLYIRGARKDFRGSQYTSARLNSRYKGDFKYGKIEVRFRNPRGNGKWPAIWMMPTEEKHGIWPRSGEIDIMEASGDKHNKIFSTVHWHTGTGGALHSRTYPFNNIDFTADFNVITLNWDADNTGKARFNVTYEGPGNRARYYTFLAEKPNAPPFHDKFYLILNLALGGRIPETTIHTIDDAALNHELAIDYIRVYQKR
jgi:beta-glucanase (GH16 family)